MRIGTMRYRITLRQRTAVEDGAGGQTVTWSDLGSVWADIQSTGAGKESTVGGEIQSQVSYRVIIRTRGDVDPGQRIVWGRKALNIVAVAPLGPDRLLLTCEEIGDAGELEGS